jgi:Helix-turn-helix domain
VQPFAARPDGGDLPEIRQQPLFIRSARDRRRDMDTYGSTQSPAVLAQVAAPLLDTIITQIVEQVAARLPSLDGSAHSRWLDVQGAADYLLTTADAVRKAAQRGQLPGHQPYGPGSRWYFDPPELDAFIRSGRTQAAAV